MRDELYALDIETTGLDAATSRVITACIIGPDGEDWIIDSILDEPSLLQHLETAIASLPAAAVLTTWNGDEFDFPFLARRFSVHGIPTTMNLTPTGTTGKYGNPLYTVDWGGRPNFDIAPCYRARAEAEGVSWSLKPVATAVLGEEPMQLLPEMLANMTQVDAVTRVQYCLSDVRVTRELATLLIDEEEAEVRAAVRAAFDLFDFDNDDVDLADDPWRIVEEARDEAKAWEELAIQWKALSLRYERIAVVVFIFAAIIATTSLIVSKI